MKTDALIDLLATAPGAVEPHATERRYATALGWAAFGATLLMAVLLGVRDDLAEAAREPMFWVKLGYPLAIAAGAILAASRLARPGMPVGRAWLLIAAPVAVIWALAAITLLRADPSSRLDLVLGQTALACPIYISLLSIPAFIAVTWAMKGLAPTNLTLAGAATGLLAGSLATAAYALHCPEMEAPFLATWYLLGMLVPTAVGAAFGPRLLRW